MRKPRFKLLRVMAVLAVIASMSGLLSLSALAAPANSGGGTRVQAQSAEVCVSLLEAEILGTDGAVLDLTLDATGLITLVSELTGITLDADVAANILADGCSVDTDSDGVIDAVDNCPAVVNDDQADTDGDGVGDACDLTPTGDTDGDGVDNAVDNCPDVANDDQADTDGDGTGDACDATPNGDDDGDGVDNLADNCPALVNPGQEDADGDAIGDACEAVEQPIVDNAANVSFQVLGLNGTVPVGGTLVITGAAEGEVFNGTVPTDGVVTIASLVPDDYQVVVGPVEGFEGTSTTFPVGPDDDDSLFTAYVPVVAGEGAGVVEVLKYDCPGATETTFGAEITEDCVPGQGVFTFYLVGDGTDDYVQLTVGANGVGETELVAGTYEVVEEGSQATTTIEVVAGELTTLVVANPGTAVPATGFVEVSKFYCPDVETITFNPGDVDGCATGPATFTFYLVGDGTDEIYGQVEVWEDGFGFIELPVGAYEVVEEGWQASTVIEVVEGEVTYLTVANPGEAPAPRNGTVNVSAFVCENISEPVFTSDSFMAVFAAEALPTVEPACDPTTTTLTFFPADEAGDDIDVVMSGIPMNAMASVGIGSQQIVGAYQSAGIDLLVEGSATIELAPGNYMVVDQTTGASTFITVYAGDFINLDLQIPAGGAVVPGSSVNIAKFYCDTVTETEFLALTAAEYSDRLEQGGAPDCVPGAATFTFYLYGDGTDDYAQLYVDGSGTIGLPAGQYEVVEEETQASFTLEVADGENTILLVNNPMPVDGEVPGGPDDGGGDGVTDGDGGDEATDGDGDGKVDGEDVTALPNTGAGNPETMSALAMAAAAASALAAAGAIRLRKES